MTNKQEKAIKGLSRRVGKNIRQKRIDNGLTIAGLSEKTKHSGYEIAKNTITNIELGRKASVSIEELFTLSQALETTPDTLLGDLQGNADIVKKEVDGDFKRLNLRFEKLEQSLRLFTIEARSFFKIPNRSPALAEETYRLILEEKLSRVEEVEKFKVWDVLVQVTRSFYPNKHRDSLTQAVSDLFGVVPVDKEQHQYDVKNNLFRADEADFSIPEPKKLSYSDLAAMLDLYDGYDEQNR